MSVAVEQDRNLIRVAGDEPEVEAVAPKTMVADLPLPEPVHWPVVERLLDAWPSALAESLEKSWGLKVRIEREIVQTGRLRRFETGAHEHALLGVVATPGLPDTGLLVIEPVVLFGVLEFVLGNRTTTQPTATPQRTATPFEASLMRPLAGQVMDTFCASLAGAGRLSLSLQKWQTGGEESPDAPVLCAPLKISFGEQTGRVLLVLPLPIMAPFSPALDGVLHGSDPASAEQWRKALLKEVSKAEVSLTAVLHEQMLALGQVRALKVGDVLELDALAETPVALLAGTQRVSAGKLGRSGPNIAIKLIQTASTQKEQAP